MAFLRSSLGYENAAQIRGKGVLLRAPVMSDYAQWAELRAMSRAHLTPWEPQWTIDELTRSAFRRRLRHYAREVREDLGYAFFVVRPFDDVIVGGVTLSNVRRGISQAATLGYWIGLPHVRRGYMSAAVEAMVGYAFDDLRLHRVEAACMPSNIASIGVLERCGFQREGVARSYLRIDGVWQDHLLYGRVGHERAEANGRSA